MLGKLLFSFVFSLIIVVFGQPAGINWFGIISGACGYTIFWHAMLSISNRKKQFLLCFLWFASIQIILLSWMPLHEDGGFWILGFVFFLASWFSLQFGLTSLILTTGRLTAFRILLISASWVLMEWFRLLPLSGFSWNFVGMALAGNLYSLQMASLFGVLGLSFWVMLVNLVCLKSWLERSKKVAFIWCVLAILPYVFGFVNVTYHKAQKKGDIFSVSLVQTGLRLGEKRALGRHPEAFIHPLEQWRRIFVMLYVEERPTDLIVLPEGALPFGEYRYIYSEDSLKYVLKQVFGSLDFMPPFQRPLANYDLSLGKWFLGNAYVAQCVSNYFNAPLIVGLEAEDLDRYYAAAFYFSPGETVPLRYEKRILVPMGEYIPFEWAKPIAAMHGVEDSFSPGTEAKIFPARVPLGISICYEETYGNIMRENRQKGSELLINISNDNWFPDSSLPLKHAEHARLRTVENGMPLARVNDNGFTMAIDSLGADIAVMKDQWKSGVLHVDVPIYTYKTLYTKFGDSLIVILCLAIVFSYITFTLLRRKSYDKKN